MSKLEELIQQYCPDGVEYVKLGRVCGFISGFAFKASLFHKEGEPICKTTNIQQNAIDFSNMEYFHLDDYDTCLDRYLIMPQDIVIGMSGTIKVGINNSNRKCYLNQRVGKFSPNKEVLNNRYLFYILSNSTDTLCEGITGGSVKNLSNNDINNLEIPIPPLPVQEEIVRVLDTFTELQAELQAELQKREQQYDYYQDLLLNKSQFSHLVTIGDMCEIKKGNTPIQKAKEGSYPLVVTTMERRSSETYQFNANAVCIPLISSRGHGVASLNHVYYQDGKFALGNILCAVIPHDEKVLKAKFLYYYLEYAKDYTLVPLMKGGANVSMHCSDIEKVKVPLPSLDEQERIITILDRFDALTTDLTAGLPAEIEKRRQQYEYYRDKLLTFKKKEA